MVGRGVRRIRKKQQRYLERHGYNEINSDDDDEEEDNTEIKEEVVSSRQSSRRRQPSSTKRSSTMRNNNIRGRGGLYNNNRRREQRQNPQMLMFRMITYVIIFAVIKFVQKHRGLRIQNEGTRPFPFKPFMKHYDEVEDTTSTSVDGNLEETGKESDKSGKVEKNSNMNRDGEGEL